MANTKRKLTPTDIITRSGIRTIKPQENPSDIYGRDLARRRASPTAFYSARRSKLGVKSRARADAFLQGLITYAREYGGPGQADYIEKHFNSAKLDYLYRTGVLTAQYVFDYSASMPGIIQAKGSEQGRVQQIIDTYNEFSLQGGRELRRRAKERRNAV